MAQTTMVFGFLLVILGVVSFVGTGNEHPTALIPAGFGMVFAVLGIAAKNEAMRKHAMHGAAALAVLGVAGTAGGFLKALRLAGGEAVERPTAVIAQAIMFVLTLIFLILCIRSFIAARRARAAA